MTDKGKIRAEIEKLMKKYDSEYDLDETEVKAAKGNVCHEILCFIDSLPKESVSEDLEKAARSYTNNIDNICGSIGEQTRDAFKAGAEWQKEKMMAEATNATVDVPYKSYKDSGYIHLVDVSRPLPVGNNKIAIICEEE